MATFHSASYDVVPLADSPDAPMTHPTEDDVREHLAGLLNGFPDLDLEIVTLHHADDAVIVEGRMRGTHEGVFAGLAPTGRRMDMCAAIFYRFEGDDAAAVGSDDVGEVGVSLVGTRAINGHP